MMRNLRILLALVALIAALTFMFSCGNYSGTYISSSPASAQMQQSGGAERSAKLSCEGEIGQRISNLKEYLNGEIGSGNDAVNVQDQRKKYFEFEVQDFPYSDGSGKGILVRIKGRLIGHMEGKKKERPRLKRLLEFVDEAVMKACIDRISFEPSVVPVPGITAFEWQSCIHPEFYCENTGACSSNQACLEKKGPTPTPTPTP